MSSWTFETFETVHKDNPQWHVQVEYRWNKNGGYSTSANVFDKEGMQVGHIFENIYGNKESARKSYKRQVLKVRRGEY